LQQGFGDAFGSELFGPFHPPIDTNGPCRVRVHRKLSLQRFTRQIGLHRLRCISRTSESGVDETPVRVTMASRFNTREMNLDA
jgi:hypothetical protein